MRQETADKNQFRHLVSHEAGKILDLIPEDAWPTCLADQGEDS